MEEALKAKGIAVITEKELDKLSVLLPDCNVTYKGEGNPHFTRRIIDGEEFTFIANIEHTEPIKGVISAYGKEKKITLWPGDIRYISATYDNIEEAYEPEKTVKLESTVNVKFDRTNVIPLEAFTCGGKVVAKKDDVPELNFPFTVKDTLCGLTLCIPVSLKDVITSVSLNGKKLYPVIGTRFEEDYMLYALGDLAPGEYCIKIEKTAPVDYWDYLSLEGDFDVDVVSNGKGDKAWYIYNISLCTPESFKVTLSSRRNVISAEKSVAEQGQPFYSGGTTYSFTAFADSEGDYMLSFGNVRDICDISVNGSKMQRIIKPPYCGKIYLNKGENDITVTVYNTYANAMECYLEPGGIIGGCYIEKI